VSGALDTRPVAPGRGKRSPGPNRPRFIHAFAAVTLAVTSACGTASSARHGEQPLSPSRDWVSRRYRTHVLVGRIWNVRENRFTESTALLAAMSEADFVLLGETHDNPDHHLIQAQLVGAISATGRQPALAFEMLQTNQQKAIDAALVGRAPVPDDVAAAVDWRHGSWPDFAFYRPIFAAGMHARLPLLAADLPRDSVRRFLSEGAIAFPAPVRELLERAGKPDPRIEAAMERDMDRAHCGELPRSALQPLVTLQRARDASLSERLLTADIDFSPLGYEQGAILIAGTGHVRRDRGVPAYLSREAPGRSVLAVALLEVSPDLVRPDDYAGQLGTEPMPFDYVVFTPATDRTDPCLELRRRREARLGRQVSTIAR